MKKINFLFYIFIVIGLFFMAGPIRVEAYDSAVFWNQPIGPTDPITLQTGFEWELLVSGIFPAESHEWSVEVNSPRLIPGVVLLKLVWDTATSDTGIVVIGGVAYKRAVITQSGPQTFSGSVTWPACSNGHFVGVPFKIYIDPLAPYNTTKNCPTDSVVQDGVCIKGTTTTTTYSPALNCPAGEGYVYQDGICIKSAVTILGNSAPTVSNLVKLSDSYCSGTFGRGDLFFQWEYNDVDGDNETRFDFQIDNNSNFSSPEVNRTITGLSNPPGTIQNQYVYVDPTLTGDNLTYNTTYYWRVKVYSVGSDSGWVYPPGTTTEPGTPFLTEPHYYPYPIFIVSPSTTIIVGQLVTFTSSSQCNPPCICTWSFGDGATASGNVATHTYAAAGNYQVTLSVSDGLFICNTSESPVIVTVDSSTHGTPEWREIMPF